MSQVEETFLDEAYSEQVAEPETETETETATEDVAEAEDSTTESTETEKEPEKEPEKTKEDKEPKKDWKFSQAMDEREKRQEWEKRALAAEAKLEKPADDVSVFDDEAGFKEQERGRTDEAIRNNSLNMSQAFAEEVYGEEKVTEALDWMKAEGVKSAYVVNQFNEAKLPFHKMVKMFDDEQARQNPEAFKAAMKQEILDELKAESEAESKKEEKQKSIKPSLASKRSAGSEKTTQAGSFEDMLQD